MDVGGLPCSLDEDCVKAPSEGRMRDFLSFLDQTASNPLQCNGRPPKESNSPGEPASTADLLSKISALEVELEDKDHNLKAFQELREREKLQEERLRKIAWNSCWPSGWRSLQEKYEQQCRKQQELLSQLQDEKKDLATRCERLSDEMRDLERRFRTKAAEMHRQYGRELERQRRAFLSGEKMKKQLEEELATQKVALQRQMEEAFEVERIQHRQEMRTLKETYEAEVAKEREALAAKQKQQTAKLEAQLTEGKKRLQGEITKAREEEQTRMKEVTSQLLAQLEQQRNKHLKELQQVEAAAKEKEKELLLQMKEAKEAAIHEATEQTKKEMQARAHKKLDHILERLSEEQLAVQNQQEKTWIEKMQKREKEFEECKNIFEKHSEKLKNDLKAEAESRLALEKQIARMEAEAEMKEKELTELKAKIEGINARGEVRKNGKGKEIRNTNKETEKQTTQEKATQM
ncbi:hypothetical protein, conserved [Eimeria maxima]|uniref:Uncharacterized protein n=1 Tax=Eimeria maxima TaxID=5804 RepID=U6MDZ2_EIMMA|nr:hypothetical protein, conserved [Eimeria maxima]CDJ60659.1 hypothetical protein, conserved [Eimeria maxima]